MKPVRWIVAMTAVLGASYMAGLLFGLLIGRFL